MILLLALQVVAMHHPGSPIGAYQNCLTPIVIANERASDDRPLEAVLQQIATRCAKERQRASEALAGVILEQNPDLRPLPSAAEKETLVNEATIRWVNDVLTELLAKEK